MAFPSGWERKQKITIQSSKIGSLLSDWTLLVTRDHLDDEVVDPSGSNASQSDGGDVRFSSDADGNTQLPCEIVNWEHDSSSGAGDADIEAYVKVPSVSASSDTDIYIWYHTDNTDSQPSASDTYGSENAWDSNYVGVWHLTDANDSTDNDNDGSVTGATTTTSGKIGGAYDFDGVNDYIDVGNGASLQCNAFTVETWIQPDNSRRSFITKGESRGGSSQRDWDVYSTGANIAFIVSSGSSNILAIVRSEPSYNGSAWYYVAAKWDGTTGVNGGALYVAGDGISRGTATGSNNANTHDVYIGGRNDSNNYEYDGRLDEVRISDTDRSDDWLEANYENQNSPSTFATAGTPEEGEPITATEINDNESLFISGHDTSNDNESLFITGHESSTSDESLFISGYDISNIEESLFIHGHEQDTDNETLFISGHQPDNSNISLFITSYETSNDNISLFINGAGTINDNITLFIGEQNTHVTETATLYISGDGSETNTITLYIAGSLSTNGNIPLYVSGSTPINSYINLFVAGALIADASSPLYIDGVGKFNRITYLIITGGNDTLNSYIPLSVTVDNGSADAGRFLFVENTQSYVDAALGRFLYINGRRLTANSSADLFVRNDAVGGSLNLIIDGEGLSDGFYPAFKSAPLFINRPNHSTSATLFLKALDNPVNSYITLYIVNYETDNSNITLAMPNVASAPINSYIRLFIEGMTAVNNNESLFVHGITTQTGTIPLVIKQGNVAVNTYANLFTKGAYIETDNIPLVIPNVIDEDTTNNIPLYILGW